MSVTKALSEFLLVDHCSSAGGTKHVLLSVDEHEFVTGYLEDFEEVPSGG